MPCWQEHPQLSPLSFEQLPSAYTWPPHVKVSASLLPHEQPPQHVGPLLLAPSPPMQDIVPVPDPTSPPTPSPSPCTHQDLDNCPVEDDWGSETLLWIHVGDCGA